MAKLKLRKHFLNLFLIILLFMGYFSLNKAFAQEQDKEPIVVNADQLEYSQIRREVTGNGHVVVEYKGSRLTCDKITVNLLTKDCLAQGRIRLEDERGMVEAESMLYNLENKKGEILEARIYQEPIFGSGKKIQRLGEKEFAIEEGFATTCSYDKPHFSIGAKNIRLYPQEKIEATDIILRLGQLPIFYFPRLRRSLKEKSMPIQIQPGKNKDWGYYLLSAWRFNLNDNLSARLLFDTRSRLGQAQGLGLNYDTLDFGKGDFKFYYTNERPHDKPADNSDEFERYLVRLRHIWEIDEDNRLTMEFYKIKDSKIEHDAQANFLKDYFYREFEKDQQPKTYLLFNHIFPDASFNFLVQKHTTTFFEEIEKLPEMSFAMPAYQVFASPVYFKTDTVFSNLMNRGIDAIRIDDLVSRLDTYNEFFLPWKVSFLRLNPYVGFRQTTYSREIDDRRLHGRSAFYSGMELSTKFFRVFKDKYRHIINPFIRYNYISDPTINHVKLVPFDSIDMLEGTSCINLELSNILQIKENAKIRDAARFRVFSDYHLKRQSLVGKGFTDIYYDLELKPLDWLGMDSDAKYGVKEGYFKQADVDLVTRFGKDRSFSIGQRYERGGGKALTTQFTWRINPKWKFRIYERYQFSDLRKKGFEEQEYSISRDLHCWEFDITFNISREHGSTIWFIFRLKAFPEYGFDFNQSYNEPRSASESSP